MYGQTYAPRRTAASNTRRPSDRQMAFLGTLLDEYAAAGIGMYLDENAAEHAADLRAAALAPGYSAAQASNTIDMLIAASKVRRSTARAVSAQAADGAVSTPLCPGMYSRDGVLIKVQAARGTGNLYGKRLTQQADGTSWAFEYAPGATRGLTQDHRLSVDAAQAWGRETGTCCVCGALLTDPVSVANGIGPVCGGRV